MVGDEYKLDAIKQSGILFFNIMGKVLSKMRRAVTSVASAIFKIPKTALAWLVYPFKAAVGVAVLGLLLAVIPLALLVGAGVLFLTDGKLPMSET
jgi:hypothetical protein